MADTSENHLNEFVGSDRFHTIVKNVPTGLYFCFEAHGPLAHLQKPQQFTCLVRESPKGPTTCVHVHTLPTDSATPSRYRFRATGRTLAEVIHNIDWPHYPSELVQLCSLLAKCDLTDSGEPIGDLALEGFPWLTAKKEAPVEDLAEQLSKQRDTLVEKATAAIDDLLLEFSKAARLSITRGFGDKP